MPINTFESSSYYYSKSRLLGGFFQVEFASDADVSFLEKMVMIEWGERNFETLSDDDYLRMNCFSGKLSCHFSEAESGKVYEWKHAIVTYYEEIAHSLTGEPMKTRVVFSPFDLRVNNLLISRYSGKTEKGTWYFYEPEEEEQPKPASKPTILVTKVEGKEEAQSNEKVTYKVVEFNQKDVTENDKKRIHWVVKIGNEKVAEHLRHGEKLELTIKEEWAGKEIIVMPYLVKPNEKVSKRVKIAEEYLSLFFDGKFLVFRVIEKGKILKFSYRAVSGRPLKSGKFDYSKERQKMKRVGPLPEGEYYINPQEIQYSKNRPNMDKLKGYIGRGTMPGGEKSWGKGRIWIKPSQIYIDGVLRDNFSIHGGSEAGSAGCIDLTDNDTDFFQKIETYRNKTTKIKLIVKY